MPARLHWRSVALVAAVLGALAAADARIDGDHQQAGGQEPPAPPSATLSAFLARGVQLPIPNRAERRLEASHPRSKREAWIEALTEFDADRGFSFQIVGEGGSSILRGRVLRKVLETEAGTLAAGAKRAALVPENYIITDAGQTEDGLVRLRLEARRNDEMLLNGFVFVTPGDAVVVRVDGRLAKNPSFWTTRVDIVRRYERVLGFSVPVEIESRAEIRFFGASSFRMTYRYLSINGMPVPDDGGES